MAGACSKFSGCSRENTKCFAFQRETTGNKQLTQVYGIVSATNNRFEESNYWNRELDEARELAAMETRKKTFQTEGRGRAKA